jgi:hypothetical protein
MNRRALCEFTGRVHFAKLSAALHSFTRSIAPIALDALSTREKTLDPLNPDIMRTYRGLGLLEMRLRSPDHARLSFDGNSTMAFRLAHQRPRWPIKLVTIIERDRSR